MRQRRQTSPVYYIDVTAMADYSMYQLFLESSGSRDDALRDMQLHYAYLFSGADALYQGLLTDNLFIIIRLARIIVSETPEASPYPVDSVTLSPEGQEIVDGSEILNAFNTFVSGDGKDILLPYDHVILFINHNMTLSNGTVSILGYAFTGTMCLTDGGSLSVVEDSDNFNAVRTTAHELGHSMSANHDGDENTCSSDDSFIMTGFGRNINSPTPTNNWKFSKCSVQYFKDLIEERLKTESGSSCLLQPLVSEVETPVGVTFPGQMYSPDQQCQMLLGDGSLYCRDFGIAASDICSSMLCVNPELTVSCLRLSPATGTACGDRQLCLGGECVYHQEAKSLDASCPYGDAPGIAFNGLSCVEYVQSFNGYCYRLTVRLRCCSSCQDVYRTVQGCEYGDTTSDCDVRLCATSSTAYKEQCCSTCNYGTTFTPASTTSSSGVCQDDPDFRLDGFTCQTAVQAVPSVCYAATVIVRCCQSCQRENTGNTYCPYGDEITICDVNECENSTTAYKQQCCGTCNYGVTTTVPPTTAPPTATTTTPLPTTTTTSPLTTTSPSTIRTITSESTSTSTSSNTSGVCQDDPNFRLNNISCQAAINTSSGVCYMSRVVEACCLSCSAAHTGVAGCEYGDSLPSTSCVMALACQDFNVQCCLTCSNAATPLARIHGVGLHLIVELVFAAAGLWLMPT